MNSKWCLFAAFDGDITGPVRAVAPRAKITVTEIATGRAIPIASNPEWIAGRHTGVC